MNNLCEEFYLYENLWEDPDSTANKGWRAPDGKLIDISTPEARQAEVERYKDLFYDGFVKFHLNSKVYMQAIERAGKDPEKAIEDEFNTRYVANVLNLLTQLNECNERIAATEVKCLEENKKIIGKLTIYTSLRTIVNLDDLLEELNRRETTRLNQEDIDERSWLNNEIRKYYK